MAILLILLIISNIGLSYYCFYLIKRMKKGRIELRKLLRENESFNKNSKMENGDIYFKIDKNFTVIEAESQNAKILGYKKDDILAKPVFETIIEDTESAKVFLEETFTNLASRPATFNTKILLKDKQNKKILVLSRIRPILNEILKCEGLSFLCKDISQTDKLNKKLSDLKAKDPFTDILNEVSLKKRFSHDFNLANRYNKNLEVMVIELKDIYNFIAQGIDFETADKMLKNVSNKCLDKLANEQDYAGRIDKTQIVFVLKDHEEKNISQILNEIFETAVEEITKLRVDKTNAEMIIVINSKRKGFTDSADAMIGRIKRKINVRLKSKKYGVSEDK